MYDLKDKVALITGVSRKRGIGRAIALRLAAEGAHIAVVDRYGPGEGLLDDDCIDGWQGMQSVVDEMRASGRPCLGLTADISDAQQVRSMVDGVKARFGHIDILVNNAALAPYHALLDVDPAEWERVIAVNLTGYFLCCQTVAREMVKRGEGGKIINMSSMRGKMGGHGLGAYSSSKFGVIGLTQVLAVELAPHKILVNAVCPGWVATEAGHGAPIRRIAREKHINEIEASDVAYADVIAGTPLGRAAQPEDIAKIVAFLASSESDYMTGQAVNVTGGRLMAH